MGGCCCSSRKSHLVGTPVYYYCPQSFEEVGPSGARAGVGSGSAFTTGLLETSIPDTFCAPAPLPYDLLLGRPDAESIKARISSGSSFQTCEDDLKASDCKPQPSSVILSPRKSDFFSKQKGAKKSADEEEDSCPICFEDYDVENPRLKTKCDHDFHLSCLLEWIERSDTCPICDKEVVFDDCLK
ncbi:unnamed protein product [Microthlaspi erraticum]|uniref:RING-type E3 ubiquitin transferase n=1 Tax=Microthlaspi erraticum TaxID=1685480 RepID=A0A6D2HPG3_9BRAS|nr:unnamed protein product [Microthlaspi erraticum]